MNLKLNRLCPGSSGIGSGWLQSRSRERAKPKSNGSKRDPSSTYSCLDPACILTFDSIQDAEDHMDTGEHVFTPENEKIYDTVKR